MEVGPPNHDKTGLLGHSFIMVVYVGPLGLGLRVKFYLDPKIWYFIVGSFRFFE